jgi:hypothetical protein
MVANGALGLLAGTPSAAVIGAVAPLLSRMLRLSHEELTNRNDRVMAMWTHASVHAQVDPERLLNAASNDPAKKHLAFTAGDAASTARFSARIVALGRALGSGLVAENDVELDVEQFVVDALAEIERPHVAALARLGPHRTEDTFLRLELHRYGAALAPILATLERLGAVERDLDPEAAFDRLRARSFYSATPFGEELRRRLVRAGADTG